MVELILSILSLVLSIFSILFVFASLKDHQKKRTHLTVHRPTENVESSNLPDPPPEPVQKRRFNAEDNALRMDQERLKKDPPRFS
jgi:hypothetical protein